jgi:hypothetical protein
MTIQNGAHPPMPKACLEKVLSRLDKVKSAGPNKWKACCPAHDDKNPSLGICQASDGKVLLHCWAGCSAADITTAIGLELRNLFPDEKQLRSGPSRAALQFEATIISIALSILRQGKPLSAADRERFEIAKQRIGGSA